MPPATHLNCTVKRLVDGTVQFNKRVTGGSSTLELRRELHGILTRLDQPGECNRRFSRALRGSFLQSFKMQFKGSAIHQAIQENPYEGNSRTLELPSEQANQDIEMPLISLVNP